MARTGVVPGAASRQVIARLSIWCQRGSGCEALGALGSAGSRFAPLSGLRYNARVSPQSLNIRGSTQLEIFRGTVDAIAQRLQTDPAQFWQQSVADDGPVEIWEIQGERYMYNGNHRYHAAIQAGADIPAAAVHIVDRTGSTIPTFSLAQQQWLPGVK